VKREEKMVLWDWKWWWWWRE